MPKLLSSKTIIKTLETKGFIFVSQKGSHIKYRKHGNVVLTVIIPANKKGDSSWNFQVNSSAGKINRRRF